jgi:hypothetical protein
MSDVRVEKSDIHPKVVNDDLHDPLWGGFSMRALACRVRKAFASQASPFTVVGQEG